MSGRNYKPLPTPLALAMALSALTIATSSLAAAQANNVADATERVIVAYKADKAAAVRSEIMNAGGRITREITRASAFAVRLPSAGLAALKSSINVDFVEADVERRLLGAQTRTMDATIVPLASAADTSTSGSEILPYGIAMVQANQVHDALTGNRKLCIVDSGIDRNHPDLVGNAANMTGFNLTVPVAGTWDSDENSHRTHVAGTVAATGGNGIGVVGVNPGGHIKLHIAKVFDASGSAEPSTVMAAVSNCADAGANIISMSLGGGDPSQAERRVFRSLLNDGVLTIAAAGNEAIPARPTRQATKRSCPSLQSIRPRPGLSFRRLITTLKLPARASPRCRPSRRTSNRWVNCPSPAPLTSRRP